LETEKRPLYGTEKSAVKARKVNRFSIGFGKKQAGLCGRGDVLGAGEELNNRNSINLW